MERTNKKGILQTLEAKSKINYEKVASRMRLAVKIAEALEKSGMSKTEFAHRMGKHPSEISKWLSGTHNFTHDTLFEIAQVLPVEFFKKDTQTFDICCVREYGALSTNQIPLAHVVVKMKPRAIPRYKSFNPVQNLHASFAYA